MEKRDINCGNGGTRKQVKQTNKNNIHQYKENTNIFLSNELVFLQACFQQV